MFLDPLTWVPRVLIAAVISASAARLSPSAEEEACTLRGRVVDGAGAPVAGARVLAGESSEATISYSDPSSAFALVPGTMREPADRPHATGETRTDGEGRFELAGMRPGAYGLLAIAVDGGLGHALEVRPEAGDAVVRVLPTRSISGRITGLPPWDPARYLLTVEPAEFQANLKFVPRVQCGAGWTFAARDLPSIDAWRVSASEWVLDGGFHARLFETRVELENGNRLEVDVSGGSRIEGLVLGPDDAPLGAVSIVASRQGDVARLGAVSAKDGRFRISGLAEGADYQIEISRHTLRETIGCGFGPRDVLLSTTARAPSVDDGLVLRVEALRDLLATGATAPDFTTTTLDGATLRLSDLRGKVVLLDFWATWCVLCRGAFPGLKELQRNFGASGDLVILGVSLDRDVGAVRRFIAGHGITWPQVAEGSADRSSLGVLYNVCSTPTTFVIGRDGRILARDLEGESLRSAVEQALASR